MVKNYFRIVIRNISRHKVFNFINITGLAIGMAASLLILLWIEDELGYEKFNENAENIYRVEEDQFYSGARYHVTVTPHPSGPVWKEKIPEIVDQTRLNRLSRVLFRKDDKVFFESSVVAADSGIFNIFTLPFLYGDKATALAAPHSIVLSEKLADKYFGKINPVGQTITMENKYQFTVTGVMKDIPGNSLLTFEGVIPYSFMKETGAISESWTSNSIQTFVQLEKGSDVPGVNTKLTDVVKEYVPETTINYLLFPLLDIHLHAQFGFEENNGPVIVIYIFMLIAVFVLLIACINFINLSTAKASSRAKEIGIRKVAGAEQGTMRTQIMFESLLLVSLAMIFSLILIGLSLKTFNNITGKEFSLSDLFQVKFIASFLGVGILAGLISGLYPAFYLSSLKPASIIKGDSFSGRGNGRLRQVLVVIQFTLSILIAVAAIFMFMQLNYLQNKDLGFDKENLISIPMSQSMKGRYYSLKRELLKETLIQGVTASGQNPVRIGSNSGGASWDGKDPEKRVLIGINAVDYDYMETMKIGLFSGRDFSREFAGDQARDTTGNFLINEEVVKLMDIGDPVGKNFRFIGLNGTIVGVLKNFHFKGADQPIEPMAFALADTNYLSVALIRLTPGKSAESLKSVEKVWKEVVPEFPLEYTFIDDDYSNLFRTELRLTSLLKYFTILALIIASLGLYGLSAYSTERRTNEIGIRKVMGADSLKIIITMAREYLVLVLISLMISLPAGWIIVGKLLKQFAYRIDLNIFVFAGIAAGALLIAFLTVSFQALKASGINPAEALKVE
jgi:predicted permease